MRGRKIPNGTWAAIVLIVGGIIIALVSLKFRQLDPATQPVTQPADVSY